MVIGSRGKRVAEEYGCLKLTVTMGNGTVTDNKDLEFTSMLIVSMKDTLKTFSSMGREKSYLQTVIVTKEIIFKENLVDMESIFGKMEIGIKVSFRMDFDMETEQSGKVVIAT